MSDEQCKALRELDPLDRAQLIARRLKGEGELGQAIHEVFRKTRHYALAHALLASLPVTETVTTNYDTLFESASHAIRRPVRVLPVDLDRDERRWLLKMHGCVSRPKSVVLTRHDYLRYAEQRGALAPPRSSAVRASWPSPRPRCRPRWRPTVTASSRKGSSRGPRAVARPGTARRHRSRARGRRP